MSIQNKEVIDKPQPFKEKLRGWTDKGIENRTTRSGKILGLCGFAQSGKDTVGKILIKDYGYKRLSFADALRNALYALNPIVAYTSEAEGSTDKTEFKTVYTEITTRYIFRVKNVVDDIGWDKAKVKFPEIRELLQRLGTEAGREIHGQDCWTNIVKKQIEAEPDTNFVITDVRFPNEKVLVESLGGKVVRVNREGVGAVNNHVSDKPLEGVTNLIWNNGSIQELEENARALIEDTFHWEKEK